MNNDPDWLNNQSFRDQAANEALAAQDAEQAAKAVPAGFKLVPVEPTPEMLKAADLEHASRGLVSIALISYRALLAAAPTPPAPEAPPDTEAVAACWQDFRRTAEYRRAAKWSEDGDIPGALFVAFRAGLRAASPKALCDCGNKPAAECDKWEPGCDLGQSPEHARVVRLDKAPAAPEAQQALASDWSWTTVRMELEASGRDDLSAWVASQLSTQAQQPAGQELPPLPPIDDYLPTDGPRWTTANFIACVERYATDYARAALAQHREPLTDEDWRTRDSSDTDEGCAALHRAHGIGSTTGEQR